MNGSMKIRMAVDLAMTADLFLLIGFPLWGMNLHMAAGVVFFLLLILHHSLNWRWYCGLFRGRWNGTRYLASAVNLLLLLVLIVLLWSSIVLGGPAIGLPALGSMMLAREIHMACAYWGFLLMSFHIGLHWDMFKGMARRLAPAFPRKGTGTALTAAGTAVALYGAYALCARKWGDYLFLRTEFAFFDYNESAWIFYGDHLAIMGCAIWLAVKISRFIRNGTMPGRH